MVKKTDLAMPDDENNELDLYGQMAAEAAKLAAIEVVTWVPFKPGDHVCGRVLDTGTMELESLRNTGEIDVWPTNTLEPIGDVVQDGEPVNLENRILRVSWLGPVQLRHYERTEPTVGDVVAMHYQSDQIPKSGLNPYKLVNCIVMDGVTGKVKKPTLGHLGTKRNIVAIDTEGEIVQDEE